jgi:hypothetical protein
MQYYNNFKHLQNENIENSIHVIGKTKFCIEKTGQLGPVFSFLKKYSAISSACG